MTATEPRRFGDVGVFGSELLPRNSVIRSIHATAIQFVSEVDALRELLPYLYQPADEAIVRVSHLMYKGVDYLAERGYNVLSVGVAAYLASDPGVRGFFNVVLWEGSPEAVLLGRELQGYAKIYGEVPDAVVDGDQRSFECREFGTTLLRGSAVAGAEFSPEQLERLRASGQDAHSLGWKYIPGPTRDTPDADYPTRTPNPVFYDNAWTASGTIEFCDVAWEATPVSHRIIERLRSVPVVAPHRSLIATGSASSPRATIQRLEPATT
ncbi:MAG: acetoacetate decarboxylase family protein [Acidimicrobiia bacterium]